MITVRQPETIYQARGRIQNGTFQGRWHFSFDEYADPDYVHFGPLRVFNDDTLSPGAVWPLHPHRNIEVVTYCAGGEFLHADEHGQGQILRKGWVQHTTVGKGMYHSEINNRADEPLRFIQVQQKAVEQADRTNRFLPLVSNRHPEALPINSEAQVFSGFVTPGHRVRHALAPGQGAYLYVLEGGPVILNGQVLPALAAALLTAEPHLEVAADQEAELLLVEVGLS